MVHFASPYYLARRALWRGVARQSEPLSGLVIDVGCGARPYAPLFRRCQYIGVEVTTGSEFGSLRKPDVFYDGGRLPFIDNCADAVVSSQVLEHVFEPAPFLREIHRILKPGGKLLLTVPFVWDEHEQPRDYARYSSFGLKYLLSANGFTCLAHERTLANPAIFVQLFLAWLHKRVRGWPSLPRKAILAAAVLPGNALGLLVDALCANDGDLFLDNIALFERSEE